VPGITVEIVNKKGLHARAAAKFVKVVAGYEAAVTVVKKSQNGEGDSPAVTGSSILGLMMLGADPGSKLHLAAAGKQANEVIAALRELVENRFGEAE
jgi:phosphocarrier protein HPr